MSMTICATEYAATENCRGATALTNRPGPKWKGVAGMLSLQRYPELDFARPRFRIEFLAVALEEIGLVAAFDTGVGTARPHTPREPFLLDRIHGVTDSGDVALVHEDGISLRRDGQSPKIRW